MAQTVTITLTSAGSDSGPFNLYSNVDGYVTAFAFSVSKASLLAGYTSVVVPDLTTTIRIQSVGACTNSIDVNVSGITTTTTTSTSTTTTSTTTIPTPYTTLTGSFTVVNDTLSMDGAVVNLGGYGVGSTVAINANQSYSVSGPIYSPNSVVFTITPVDPLSYAITSTINTLSCPGCIVSVSVVGSTTVNITITPSVYSGFSPLSGSITVQTY
jgi:hypothetical protein